MTTTSPLSAHTGAPPAVEMRAITKRFPGVVANDNVSFTVGKGEIHALLGENGAGKSTLMSVLAGLYKANEGEILIDGRVVDFGSPRDAIAAGVGMVHQHFMLVPVQTVAENIFLGMRDVPLVLNYKKMAAEVQRIGAEHQMPVDPNARIWQLSVGEQQRVEIIKMLFRGAQVLILDEPTAVLTPQETEGFFRTLRSMAASGKTIIFISHKLDEVLAIADRITVLRGGKVVSTVAAKGMTKPQLASLMVGREVLFRLDKPAAQLGDVRLSLKGVSAIDNKGLPALRELSLSVRSGEIVGIAGVAGNGQSELAEIITGLRPATTGSIEVNGAVLPTNSPRKAIEAGVAYVPEDRNKVGSAPNLSVSDNLAIKNYRLPAQSGRFVLKRKRMDANAKAAVADYRIATPSIAQPARKLSGGNLQKVILAREISSAPKVLVAAYPTRGLDIGAMENVRKILLQERSDGAAILLISEELDEIFGISDTIVVLYEGRVMETIPAERANREVVGMLMAGHHPDEASVGDDVAHNSEGQVQP